MKKWWVAAVCVIMALSCVGFAACGDKEKKGGSETFGKLGKVTEAEWKAALGFVETDNVTIEYTEKIGDQTDGVTYKFAGNKTYTEGYETSVGPDGEKHYKALTYYVYETAEQGYIEHEYYRRQELEGGTVYDWETRSEPTDRMTVTVQYFTAKALAGLFPTSVSDMYADFTYDEADKMYVYARESMTVWDDDTVTDFRFTIVFQAGKVVRMTHHFEHKVGICDATYVFKNYGNTVVELPAELQSK